MAGGSACLLLLVLDVSSLLNNDAFRSSSTGIADNSIGASEAARTATADAFSPPCFGHSALGSFEQALALGDAVRTYKFRALFLNPNSFRSGVMFVGNRVLEGSCFDEPPLGGRGLDGKSISGTSSRSLHFCVMFQIRITVLASESPVEGSLHAFGCPQDKLIAVDDIRLTSLESCFVR